MSEQTRLNRDEYFMAQALMASLRSTCDRARVGCVIVNDKKVLATGYNGSKSGEPHCDEAGHEMVDGHCVRTIHAERNAISRAWTDVQGATVYVTHSPCRDCYALLKEAEVGRIVALIPYGQVPDDVEFVHSAFLEKLHKLGLEVFP